MDERQRKHHAIILAGGVGSRMGHDIPKQFIEVLGKPILAYTLEGFQRHALVDTITVVCVEGWADEVREYPRRYGISKLRAVAGGGSSSQDSISRGVDALVGTAEAHDIVIIHDGVRPLVDEMVLTDVIEVAEAKGNAVTAMPYNEQIFVIDEDDPSITRRYIPRETLRRVSTPQAYRFEGLKAAYDEARAKGVGMGPTSYANTMYADLGIPLNLASGSDKNIKLTTQDDLDLFQSYVEAGRIGGVS